MASVFDTVANRPFSTSSVRSMRSLPQKRAAGFGHHGERKCGIQRVGYLEPRVRRVPRGRLTALLGADAGDDDVLDAVVAQPRSRVCPSAARP